MMMASSKPVANRAWWTQNSGMGYFPIASNLDGKNDDKFGKPKAVN